MPKTTFRYRPCDDSVVISVRIPKPAWNVLNARPGSINHNAGSLICNGLGLSLAQIKATHKAKAKAAKGKESLAA